MTLASFFSALFLALASISEGVYAQSEPLPLVEYTFDDYTNRTKNTGIGDTLDGILFPAENNSITFDEGAAVFSGTGCIEAPVSHDINDGFQRRVILLDFIWDGSNPNDEPQIVFEEGGKTKGVNIVISPTEPDAAELVMGVWEASKKGVEPDKEFSNRLFISTTIQAGKLYNAAFELRRTGKSYDGSGTVAGYLNRTLFGYEEIDWFGIGQHSSRNCIGGMRQDTRFFNGTASYEVLSDGFYFHGQIDNFQLYSSKEIWPCQKHSNQIWPCRSMMPLPPTPMPTAPPTKVPSVAPSPAPSLVPSTEPSSWPTTANPTLSQSPSVMPTFPPTSMPTVSPSMTPSSAPSPSPAGMSQVQEITTMTPSMMPTFPPTSMPTVSPSMTPSSAPSPAPSLVPSTNKEPTSSPTTANPNLYPTAMPSRSPSLAPTTKDPTMSPTIAPSVSPTANPTLSSTAMPSASPSLAPTAKDPTMSPTIAPSMSPTAMPSPPSPEWTTITYDDFENGWGNFTRQVKRGSADDPGDAILMNNPTSPQSVYVPEGNSALRIRDGSGEESSVFNNANHNVTAYSNLRVQFEYCSRKMNDGDSFLLEYSSNYGDDSTNWTTVKGFVFGQGDFQQNSNSNNQIFYNETVNFLELKPDLNLDTTQARIRFQCNGKNNGDKIYIDNVKFEGLLS